MKDEYIIINKTAIQKRIEEWEVELQECFKAPVGEFNSDYVSTLQQAIATAREILSQSTPLIPEIEKHFLAGREFKYFDESKGEQKHHTGIGMKYDTIEDYISTLKLDI